MNTTESLAKRLTQPAPILMDGALGTELTRRGFLFNTEDWIMANLTHPEIIESIHFNYASAGAELHIANSFASGRHVLKDAGLENHFETLNRKAVDLCRNAIAGTGSRTQWIAGSVSTFAKDHDRNNLPEPETLKRNVREQSEVLADAGCDLICLEMLFDVETTIPMLKGALASSLPVSLGLVCAQNESGQVVLQGSRNVRKGVADTDLATSLKTILNAVPTTNDLIVTVMHSEIDHTGAALNVIRQNWDGGLAAYPNIGRFSPPGGWDTSNGGSPNEFAKACQNWLQYDLSFIGGCCGAGPDHIAELSLSLGSSD